MKQFRNFVDFFIKYKIIRYIISGGIATGVNVSTLFIFAEFFGMWYVAAGTLGFTFGIIASFLLQKFWTFQNTDFSFKDSGRQFFFYLFTAVFNLGLNSFLIYIFTDKIGTGYFLSALIASALVAVESFFIYRIIFRAGRGFDFFKVLSFFRRHLAAFLLAILVLILYLSPHFFNRDLTIQSGAVYYPVPVKGHFDEGGYIVRAVRAFGGDLLVGDASLKEYQAKPSHLPILNPVTLAFFGKILGSFENGLVAASAVMPAISFFFIYLIAFELSGRRTRSVVFASVFIILPHIGLLPSKDAVPFLGEPAELYFARFDYPALTFPFFAMALYWLIRLLRRPSGISGVLFGLSAGILFYTYFFDWVYILTAAGLVFVGSLWLSLDKVRRALVFGFLTTFAVSVPYWISYLSLRSLPSFRDVVERLGVERGRKLRLEIVWFSYVRAVLLTLVLAALFKTKDKIKFLYGAALVLPVVFLLNIQIITGFVPQPDHFHRTGFLGLALAFWLILSYFYDRLFRARVIHFSELAAGVLIAALFIYGFWTARIASVDNYKLYAVDSSYYKSYHWLRSYTDRNSVVGALAPTTNEEVALIAGRFVFLPNGFLSLAPNEEIWRRLGILGKIYSVSVSRWQETVASDAHYFFSDFYHDPRFNSYFKGMKRAIPEEILKKEIDRYSALAANYANPYVLDYILIGPRELSLGASRLPTVPAKEVYRDGGVSIYELEK